MNFNSPHVYYLEPQDFNGRQLVSPLYNPNSEKQLFSDRCILLLQSNGCGYCTQFKPVYQQVANTLNRDTDFCTIQMDQFGDQNLIEQVMGQPIQGVPLVVKMYRGIVIPNSQYMGDRSPEDFYNWCLM